MSDQELVTARELEKRGILKRGTAYKMARARIIPSLYVGAKSGGIRFSPADVLAALKAQPAQSTGGNGRP
jgi:hypothetical protein